MFINDEQARTLKYVLWFIILTFGSVCFGLGALIGWLF